MALKDSLKKASADPVMRYFVWGAYILVVVAIVIVISKVYEAVQAASVAAGQAIGAAEIEDATGITPDRQAFLRQQAAVINGAIQRFFGWGYWTDGQTIVNAINQTVTVAEANLLSTFFKETSGDSLLELINDSLIFHDKDKINPDILSGIQ